jgi:hypothetical protein
MRTLAVIAKSAMGININSENYESYKRVFSIISKHFFKELSTILPAEQHPIAVLENWEAKSKSLAKKGLQSGLNDTLSSLKHCSRATLVEINCELEKENLPNLNTLLGSIQRTVRKIIAKRKISTLDEFYIVKEIVDDESSEISIADRGILSECLEEFERHATNR